MHAPIDRVSIGQYLLIFKLLKGAFYMRPPLHHYSRTLDVSRVLVYLDSHSLEHTNFTLQVAHTVDSYVASPGPYIEVGGSAET